MLIYNHYHNSYRVETITHVLQRLEANYHGNSQFGISGLMTTPIEWDVFQLDDMIITHYTFPTPMGDCQRRTVITGPQPQLKQLSQEIAEQCDVIQPCYEGPVIEDFLKRRFDK